MLLQCLFCKTVFCTEPTSLLILKTEIDRAGGCEIVLVKMTGTFSNMAKISIDGENSGHKKLHFYLQISKTFSTHGNAIMEK